MPTADPGDWRGAPRWARVLLLTLVVLAFGLRLVAGWESLASPLEAGTAQIWDSRYYVDYASQIARGSWLGEEAFYLAPLYPYALAAVMLLTGTSGTGALGAILAFQAALGALSVLLIGAIGARVGGFKVALLASALASIYGPFVYQTSIVMPTSVILAAHLLALWLLVRAAQLEGDGVDHDPGRPSLPWLVAGLSLALATLSHGTGLAVAAGALAWIALGGAARPLRRRAAVAALVLCGLLPPILATTARNYAVSGDVVLLTSNAGKNLYIGHNPVADGTFNPHWFPVWGSGLRTYIRGDERGPEDPKPSEVSRWLADKAMRFAIDHPDKTIAVTWRKIRLFLNWYETCQDDNPYFAARYSNVLSLPLPGFALIGSLGLAGLLPALLKRRRYGPLLVCLLAELSAFAIMFVLARYRAFAAAILMVLGAQLVLWLVARIARRRWKALGAGLAAIAAATAFVTWDVPGFDRQRGFGQQHVAAARILMQRGELEAAREEARAALSASFSPYRDLDVRKATVDALLGEIALALGDPGAAVEHFERGLDRVGGRPAVRAGVAGLLERLRSGAHRARSLDQDSADGSTARPTAGKAPQRNR